MTEYNSNEMSDGEKVILFYIAQVINAPEKGFIIIDEPEMFLHKAILIKLWDKLELLREDCMFLYLTHNVEFAVSRHNAKKIWMKSYKHPQNWSFEEVTKNKIPEKLVLELLGTRTVILFCESKNKNGLDEQIYNVLYPKFRVVSVSGCKNVINYTKSYNSLENKIEKAIGIIDKDFNENSTNRNEIYENIFVLNFAEIENIFFLENVLLHFAKLPNYKKDNINILKSKIISKYERDLEIQILKYVEFRINKHFKNGFLKKSKKLDDVKSKYDEFHEKVKIEEWYKERKIFIEELITRNDYDTILKFYNNKGLVQYANEFFNINNYQEQVINLLKSKDEKLISIILGAMPEKLNEIHNKIKVFSA